MAGEQYAPRQEQSATVAEPDIARLIEFARKNPGVSEVMDAYERYAPVVVSAEKYFDVLRPKYVLSLSTSSAT